MNLSKLFEMQKVLDDRIIAEHHLEEQDLLPNKILALQVELGELANEWQGFKHWKVNPQPKEHVLEEYVDGLHFILSIGLELGQIKRFKILSLSQTEDSITDQFRVVFWRTSELIWKEYPEEWFNPLLTQFIILGEMLGFTSEQIEQAYFEKNKINHQRQDNHY